MKKIALILLSFLFVSSVYSADPKAKRVRVEDAGSYFTDTNVEDVFQEFCDGTGTYSLSTTGNLTAGTLTDGTLTIQSGRIIAATTITTTTLQIIDGNSTITEDGSGNIVITDAVTGGKTLAELSAGAAGGDAWSDAVDADILPTGNDNTFDLGSAAASFADMFWDGTGTGNVTGALTGNASTASNLSGTPALPDGTTATTQAGSDNSTKLATTAYADAAGGSATAWDDIGNPDADDTIALAGYEVGFSSTLDEAAHIALKIDHIVADVLNATTVFQIQSTDDAPANLTYIKIVDDTGVTPNTVFAVTADGAIANDGNITSLGTIEGATLTEGGTGVYNITESDGAYQPLEATLTDIADGTINENLVNTANPWADNEVSDTLTSSTCTGNAATVTNATFTTALTVNTGTLTLTADVGNASVLTIGAGAVSVSGANTGDDDTPDDDSEVPNDITVNSSALITSAIGFDAVGAVDLDYGSIDVTDHTFVTDGTGNAEIVLPDDSIGAAEMAIDAYDLGTSLEADTLTEGGNAVYNSTETPGGELGGTWASPTIDADAVSLDEVGDPVAASSITMGNNEIVFVFGGNDADNNFELDATGANAGDVLHIHQHTGNPTGGNLIHAEAEDADVNPLVHIESLAPDTTEANVVSLLIDTDIDDDTDFIPLEIRDDNGINNDLLFQIDSTGTIQTGIWNAGAITSTGQISGGTLTDGSLVITGGVVTGATLAAANNVIEADTITNATFTTALTVDTGTLTLTADVGNASVLTIGAGAVSVSGANTGDNTVATSGDAAVDFFGAGVDAVTDATTCTDIEGTHLSITTGTLNVGALKDLVATSPLLVNATTNVDDVIVGTDADITFSMPAATNATAGHASAAHITAIEANTAHAADNTQAHSDYLLNSGADTIAGALTINPGTLFLQEQADASADVEAQGQIWVNTATPNELWFTDDAGTDTQLAVSGAGDISDVYNCASGDCSAIVMAAADSLDCGAGELELPQASPGAPDADGEVDLDMTDGTLVIQNSSGHTYLGASTDVVYGKLLHQKSITILEPDKVQAVIDNVPMMAVEADEFPHGIVIVQVYLKTDANSSLSVNLEKWATPADGAPDTLTTIATSTSAEANEAPDTTGVVGTSEVICLDLDTADVNWLILTILYYEGVA